MFRPLPVALCAVIIVLMLTAGCTNANPMKTGASPLVTAASGTGSGSSSAGTNSASSGVCGGASFDTDPANCGKCGALCPENAVCSGGNCYCRDGFKPDNNQCVALPAGTTNGCPQGMSPCSATYCYELQVDRSNCGLCGYSCPSTKTCSAGQCVDAQVEPTSTSSTEKTCEVPGQTKCGSRCVNLTTSIANCGSCGKGCLSAAPNCCNGGCINYSKDPANCGFCGHRCAPGATCSLGSCRIKVTGIVYSAMTVAPSFAK